MQVSFENLGVSLSHLHLSKIAVVSLTFITMLCGKYLYDRFSRAGPSAATAEESLWQLLDQIKRLAPQLTPASLAAASVLIGGLSPIAPRQSTAMQAALNAEEPLVPHQLTFDVERDVHHEAEAARGAAADDAGGAAVDAAEDDGRAAASSWQDEQGGADLWLPGGGRLDRLDRLGGGYLPPSPGGHDAFERDWAARRADMDDDDDADDADEEDELELPTGRRQNAQQVR